MLARNVLEHAKDAFDASIRALVTLGDRPDAPDRAIRAALQISFEIPVLAGSHMPGKQVRNARLVFAMIEAHGSIQHRIEGFSLHAMDTIDFGRPVDLPCPKRQRPVANLGNLLGQFCLRKQHLFLTGALHDASLGIA